MASANDFKALEAGYYLNEGASADSDENKLAVEDSRTKETTASKEPQTPSTTSKFNKMASLRYLFMTLALLSVFIVSLSSAAAVRSKDCHGQTAEEIKFQELLASVSDEALHEVLEEHVSSKYKPGVWREDRSAMSAVHKDNAAKATHLVQLARRQNVSMTTEVETVTQPTTSTIVVPPTSTDEPEPSTTADPEPSTSETPDEPTTTPEPTTPEPTTAEPTTEPEPTQDPTVSDSSIIVPPVTSTGAQPSLSETEISITEAETETSAQTTEPPVSTESEAPQASETSERVESSAVTSEIESSTDAPETTQTSAEPTPTPTSPSARVTSTSQATSEAETTVTSTKAEETSTTVQITTTRPSSSMVTSRATTARSTTSNAEESSTASEEEPSSTTQEVVFTTIRPDGSRSTITSYTIVPAAEATQDGPADPTFTPEVQDAAASITATGFLGFAVIGITALIAAL